MSKAYRLSLIAMAIFTLICVSYFATGSFSFASQFWFASGLLLLVLLSLIDQPHFSKDANIFVNAATAAMSLLLVTSGDRDFLYWCFFSATVYLLISSYLLLWFRERPLAGELRLIRFVSRLNRELGKPETLFSAFFLWGAFKQFGSNSDQFNALFLFWVVFAVLNIPSVAKTIEELLFDKTTDRSDAALGQIFGVQSKNTFLVKLLDSSRRKQMARLFSFVEFYYSSEEKLRHGLIIDVYMLDREQWIKVLSNSEIEKIFLGVQVSDPRSADVIYLVGDVPMNDVVERLVGVVTENSRIDNVKFIYNSKTHIEEGQLVEIVVNGRNVLYQIVEGVTRIETLEQKNQTGLIIGEAFQLGTWNSEKLQFEQLGWVPTINSPVFLARNIEEPPTANDEYVIGRIPNTNYPVTLNKSLAMSHHMAVIGVTGTGKSVFSRNLIRQFLNVADTKCICIDFTGEYVGKFEDLNARSIISQEVSAQLFKKIDAIERAMADNYGKDTDKTIVAKKEISESIFAELEAFLKSDDKLAIFELPEVENTSGVLTYTKTFFRILFHIAKKHKNFGRRISLVLEEAHTIVPEWNFSGVSDKVSQPLLNSIAQIALQGRKYNVGLLVIAQRTANVSKTILTQCNTIVSFQEFDKTSSEFLANYFGQEVVVTLPRLKFRQAIAAGKAFKSSVPMIFEVPEMDA
ncbi:MAG: DUF87 domain-containing protein [Polaromonas sp.]|uniref:ATP-binding protein n=1 Tax=Polaromonas sp. TaxID=1869339 RepID=UPI0024886524|nr:DUF87 domain-containing protein [Polaromonas sp.]MDI1237488.1 DUF87 domain-containing protein [Polaromonas sp.]